MINIKLIALALLCVTVLSQTELNRTVCGATAFDPTIVPSSPADVLSLVASNQYLTFGLLNQYDESHNVFISSYRIRRILTALAAGAMGATFTELQNVSDTASINSSDLLAAFDAYDVAHENNIVSLNGAYNLSLISGPYVPMNFTINQDYINEITQYLDDCVHEIDYSQNLTNESQIINDYAYQSAGADNLITADLLASNENLLWLYASTFNFSWLNPFYSQDTVQRNFTLGNGTLAAVPCLFNPDEQVMFIKENGYTFIHKMIANGNYGISFIIPDIGSFESVKNNLSQAWYWDVRKRAAMQDVAFYLPVFHTEEKTSLKAPLMSLGLATTFVEGQADFSGIDSKDDVYLSDYLRDNIWGFDEAGSEPNVPSMAPPGNRVISPSAVEVAADHPFIAVVATVDTIDFIIQLVDPTAI